MFAASKTASVSGGYQIQRSLRFNRADSAYLSRTPASAGNRKAWTMSFWIKRSDIVNRQIILEQFLSASDTGYCSIEFASDAAAPTFVVGGYNTTWRVTTQVFRDVSAWYHIVVAVDTTLATANNRVRIYLNGSEITSFSTLNNPTQNADTGANSTGPAGIGSATSGGTYLNGYMTEIYMVDGQQLTPSSFGETNAQTGVWQPKAYSGSYGTNGFYLNFSDNSNTTAATLGKDYSGNGNNWTPNNFSVTAGAGNDSLVDSPTSYGTDTGVGGTVRGNYSTLSPIYGGATGITNGNLDVTLSGGTQYGSMSLTTGKWYWEVTPTASLSGAYLGVMDSTFIKTDATWGTTTTSCYVDNGNKYGIGGTGAYGATYTTGDVIGFALDLDAGTLVFYKNGTSQGTASSGMTGREWRPMLYATGGTYACNFGQRPFAYTAPSGYKALCTQNLPTPTIGATTATQANQYFDVTLYTGNATARSITNSGSMQPDLVWTKDRSLSADHRLYDSVRGATKRLFSSATLAESADAGSLTAFNSNGFSVGASSDSNQNSSTYAAWQWKANGSGSTNTAGSITSTVSANTTSGFSIVTYTGTGANASVGHGLNVIPSMIIVKSRSSALDWPVGHVGLTNQNYYLTLNSTNAQTGDATVFRGWGSTNFSPGTNSLINASGGTYVAYCFAEVAGYSKFGSWTGNGSADGPFVYCGFKPRYVLFKDSSNATWPWIVVDTARNTYNVMNAYLSPNNSNAEATNFSGNAIIDSLSNGFKVRSSDAYGNTNGDTYIFMAFAESPFKYSLAR